MGVMAIVSRENHALDVNPPAGSQYLTTGGSDWLWAVTAIYIISFLIIAALAFKPFHNERIFHHIFAIALLVGSIAYFAQASDLAWRVVATANNYDTHPTYQIFWAKYVNWVVSFPAVILALGIISGVSWTSILYGIFLSWIWIISYLVSAFTSTNYKWGFFAFGTVAYIALAAHTLLGGLGAARRLGVGRHYTPAAGWVNLLWLLYPIAFGVSDGGNVIGVSPSFIFFGILDVLMVPVLAFLFVILSRKWDYGRLNLYFTQHGRVPLGPGGYPEKSTAPVASGVTGPAV